MQNNALAQASVLQANAGPDLVLEQESRGGAQVTLKGYVELSPNSPLTNPENLVYIWQGPFGSVKGQSPTVILPAGVNEISLVVKNGEITSSPDKAIITVQDTVAPRIFIPPNPVIFFASGPKVPLVLNKPAVRDRVGPVRVSRDGPKDFLPVDSTTVITWTAMDAAGNQSSATQKLIVLPFESILHVHSVSPVSFPEQNAEKSDLFHSPTETIFLKITGQFITTGATDGIDITREVVTVVFGENKETLASGSFVSATTKDSYIYKSENKGIREILFQEDGSFTLFAEGWVEEGRKEPKVKFFSFKIGNDRGEAYLPLDKNCSLESHRH
ncbi:MAG: hypothetical protein COV66_11185 [Nitrospinae bacterium CG11_big_fil_rev_8_21_14_0_20_45_15]|nr:MAG: hypothetical protein COV66_11185 [Nitrospinae bacterium CG11_big_fil_rev_8_21_14_0_20_45_15]